MFQFKGLIMAVDVSQFQLFVSMISFCVAGIQLEAFLT